MAQLRVRIDPSWVDRFRRLSGDLNPLHGDREYSRATPFGRPIVFGVLGALLVMARSLPRNWRVDQFTCEFRAPMTDDTEYDLSFENTGTAVAAEIRDGRQPVLVLRSNGGPRVEKAAGELPLEYFGRYAPAERVLSDLGKGLVLEGQYSPHWGALAALLEALGCDGAPAWLEEAGLLTFSSYLVGMELPGRQALFSKVTVSRLKVDSPGTSLLSYRSEVVSNDPRFSLVRVRSTISTGAAPLASIETSAFVRLETERPMTRRFRSTRLAGRHAIVTGAGRGLGAEIALELAAEGCRVTGTYSTSRSAALALQELAEAEGLPLDLVQCDAANPEACRRLAGQIRETAGGLDILVCNAFPTPLALPVSSGSLDRVENYLLAGVAMALAPVAAYGDLLRSRRGTIALISSELVSTPVAGMAHYTAAKAAAEGLVRTAALEYPELNVVILRPPRLLTDMSNTPSLRQGALPPARIARTVAEALVVVPEPPTVRLVCSFE